MKYYILLLLLSSFSYSFSQKDSIIIKGVVTSNEQKKIKNALVHLVSSKGHRYEYKTDSTGKYRFRLKADEIFTCTITVASDKHTTAGSFRNMGFLATKDNAIFELTPGKSYEKDFKLTQIPFCGPIAPSILFYKNSILSCNDSLRQKDSSYYESFQNTISILYLSLIEEPSIIIEIHGHASSNEKNSEHLALYRAQLIKEILVAKGINKKRMVVKSWGHNKLIVSNKIIKKAKTKEEKSALHTRNQRVVYRVISWDFAEDKN